MLLFAVAPTTSGVVGSKPLRKPRRVVVIPNNQLLLTQEKAWYENFRKEVEARFSLECSLAAGFPNPYDANTKRWESVWLGYLRDQAQIDMDTVVIGHGTGADALLRYLERSAVHGAVLVTPCDEYHAGERHGRPYHWIDICRNCNNFVEHIYSTDDAFVSEEESQFVGKQLQTQSLVLKNRGRIVQKEFPELADILESRLLP